MTMSLPEHVATAVIHLRHQCLAKIYDFSESRLNRPFTLDGITFYMGVPMVNTQSSNDTKLVSRTQVSKEAFGVSKRSWLSVICHALSGWKL
jgi:hypothetical protein